MTSITVDLTLDRSRSVEMPPGRLLRAYFTEARYECVRMLRAPAFAVPFLILPVALYVFFGVVMIGGSPATGANPNVATYLFMGFSVMGVMGPGMFGFGVSIALEREQGLLTLKRALPMPPAAYLLSKMCMAVLFSAIVMLTMVIAAATLSDKLHLTAGQFLGVSAILILGTLPFCAIGMFIGTLISGRVAPAIVNVIYLPLIYLSGLFFPLPKSIQVIALFSPAFHLDQLGLLAGGVGSILPPMMHVGALVGVTVLFGGLAIRRLARNG
jgi:ABC-2 type transport system permease protein